MATEIKGHCVCGAITYTFHSKTPEIHTLVCHCDTCQRLGGSPYAFSIGTTKDDLKISGPIKTYTTIGDSGSKTHKYFCPTCGSSLAREHESMAPSIFVLGGTIDESLKKHLQPPGLEVWANNKLPFAHHFSPTTSFPGNP